MDAYCNYIVKLTEARSGELRREAAEYALSRTSRRSRRRVLIRRRRASAPVAAPVTVLQPSRVDGERELSRTA